MRFLASLFIVVVAFACGFNSASAAQGDCGQPRSDGPLPVATDCLFILQVSVGSQTCEPACICDINGSGTTTATDALTCLNVTVGGPGELACECSGTTTTTSPASTTTAPASTTTTITVVSSTTTTTLGPFPPPPCDSGEIVAAAGSHLDAGWNGAGHNASIVEGASIFFRVVRRCGGDGDVCEIDNDCLGQTCDLTCDCDSSTDTACEMTGPAGAGNCLVAMEKSCATNDDCGASDGACVKFFGPPLPLSAEGTPTCVTTYFQQDIVGTADTATGEAEASATLRSRVHLGIQLSKPCPRCGPLEESPEVGDEFTCDGGPRNGQGCTVDAASPEFGGVSTDCPPEPTSNVSGVGLAINFRSVSTGTRSIEALLPCGGSLAALHPSNGAGVCLDTFAPCSTNDDCLRCTESPTTACATNDDCTGSGTCAAAPEQPIACGVYCHCGFCDGDPDAPCFSDDECDPGETCEQGSGATQQLQGNKCTSLSCGLSGAEECCSSNDPGCANPTPVVGECADQPFRGCSNNSDCTIAGATGPCDLFNRRCFENRIERTGEPSPLGFYCTRDPDIGACSSNADCAVGNCVRDSAEPTTVALFCIPPTASASINVAAGIPGPGAISFTSAVHMFRCGDGRRAGIEECDDGNNVSGDGCDEICRLE